MIFFEYFIRECKTHLKLTRVFETYVFHPKQSTGKTVAGLFVT